MDIGLEQGIFKYPESNKISTESSEHKEIQVKTENKNRAAEFIRKEKEQLIDKITTYDEYLASDEMARKRQGYAEAASDDED